MEAQSEVAERGGKVVYGAVKMRMDAERVKIGRQFVHLKKERKKTKRIRIRKTKTKKKARERREVR